MIEWENKSFDNAVISVAAIAESNKNGKYKYLIRIKCFVQNKTIYGQRMDSLNFSSVKEAIRAGWDEVFRMGYFKN